MALLAVESLSTGYGRTKVLWDVSLSLRPSSVMCVLGANGAGKTTLARTLAGLVPAWEGRIMFDGARIDRMTPEARARAGVVLVPQGRRVFPELTVDENLAVARFAARGRGRPDMLNKVRELFPALGALSKRRAGSLSGGEQQMLATGRALMAEPRLLILDEPSLGLAPVVVQTLYDAIRRIAEHDVAILLIEQLVGEALAVAQDVAVLEAGRIVVTGDAERFRDQSVLAETYLGGSTW
jgi:branched-chain amino acid transport system ATP-binding protein